VKGNILSYHDSWGHDFLLENSALRRDIPGIALTYTEIEFMSIDSLHATLNSFPAEVMPFGSPNLAHPHSITAMMILHSHPPRDLHSHPPLDLRLG
jgi:hypothetical protein